MPSSDGFYQTEGYKAATGLPVGATFVSGDIYIPGSWQGQAAAYASVGLWGTLGIADVGPASAYPIVGFYNGDAGGGKIRYFDGAVGYVDAPDATINYDGWNTLRLNYLPGPTGETSVVEVVVNGTVVGTITGDAFSAVNPETDSQYEVILNSRANGISPYDVYWSNLIFSLSEAYSNAASLAPTAIVVGDTVLGTYVDRRGLDWGGTRQAWIRGVLGKASFDYGNGTVDTTIAGTQLGLDLASLGDPSTRIGVTAGYADATSDITAPSGYATGSSTLNAPSIGGYITHASGAFYADLLGQYRMLNFDVTSPMSEKEVKGGSIDVAAEAGFHVPVGGSVLITPMAQMTYQHLRLDSATLDGLDVDWSDTDALIGRLRLMAQAGTPEFMVYGAAGVSTDLLGNKVANVGGLEYTGTTGGPMAEFSGGVQLTSGSLSMFGSGQYSVSFDGASSNYAGRLGVRGGF